MYGSMKKTTPFSMLVVLLIVSLCTPFSLVYDTVLFTNYAEIQNQRKQYSQLSRKRYVHIISIISSSNLLIDVYVTIIINIINTVSGRSTAWLIDDLLPI